MRMTSNRVLALAIILLAVVGQITGCSGTTAAYKSAEGMDQTAKVVAEHYYALVKEANQMKKAGTLSGDNLVKAQDLVRDTRPAIDSLAGAAMAYEELQTATTEVELDAAIIEVSKQLTKLIDIINMARE